MKRFLYIIGAVAVCLLGALTSEAKLSGRVLLIPLDDRPMNLQLPVRLGLVGDFEVVTPPKALLGGAKEFGSPDKILEWLAQQDLKSFDAAIFSIDMISYGGLAASRTSRSAGFDLAKRRLETIRELHRRNPRLPIYGTSAILRAFPVSNLNEKYRALLENWARISEQAGQGRSSEADEIAKSIPSEILDEYRNTRTRNLNISLLAVQYVRDGILNHLILAQDVGGSEGVSFIDRDKLLKAVNETGVERNVSMRTGVEESSMLHLARAINRKHGTRPRVAINVSRSTAAGGIPAADALRKSAEADAAIAGCIVVGRNKTADITLFISDAEKQSVIASAAEIEKEVRASRISRVAVADIGLKSGDVYGESLTAAMRDRSLFGRIAGYSARDTAEGTIGIALAQGTVSYLSEVNSSLRKGAAARRMEYARKWFMLDRLLEDVVYRTATRPEIDNLAQRSGWNPRALETGQTGELERISSESASGQVDEFLKSVETFKNGRTVCDGVKFLKVLLPWKRTSDPELDFELNCRDIRR